MNPFRNDCNNESIESTLPLYFIPADKTENKNKYGCYLFENGISEVTTILDFCLSIETWFPKLLVLPATLMRSCRNFSCYNEENKNGGVFRD